MNADLHCHSTVSDGQLSPADLVRRAKANGVTLLSLTDHDEVGGLAEARAEARALGVGFVNGVEISATWGEDQTLHIVGLGVDDTFPPLLEGLAHVRSGRDARALKIAAELEKVGIHGAYEGALRHAGNPALLGRAHFARYIVECGRAREVKSVFDYWLAKGKPGYVPHFWATLEQAVAWIVGAGGVPVLAHPGRYRITKAELRQVLKDFRELGGGASRWCPVARARAMSMKWRVMPGSSVFWLRGLPISTVRAKAGSIWGKCRRYPIISCRSGANSINHVPIFQSASRASSATACPPGR